MEPQEMLAWVAEKMNVSVDELREKLQILIHEAAKDTDPQIVQHWKDGGKDITPEQYIGKIVEYVRDQGKEH